MARLTKAQQEAQAQIRRLTNGNMPPEELARHILSALLIAVPAEHAILFGVDPSTLLFNRLLAYGGPDIALYRSWLQQIYLVREPGSRLTFPRLMRANLPVVAIREYLDRCWGFPAGYFANFEAEAYERRFRDIRTPAGGILRAWFTARGKKIAALELGRTEANREIRLSEIDFLRSQLPIIGRLLDQALARDERPLQASGELPATGVVVLDQSRQITLQTATVARWFQAMRDSPPLLASSNGVPTAVWTVIAALRAGLGAEGGEGAGSTALHVATRFGAARVEATPVGDKGSVAVTLTAHRPSFPPELPWWWPLTPAERRVLSLVVKGLSNRQIAAALLLSESTVESHLTRAFKKLKVSSRTQFVTRLFEALY